MAIPNKAVGYGNNSTARNVLAFYTDQALSSAIQYYAYDNDQTFPTTDTLTTVTNIVLAGKTGNGSKSMISLVDTTNAAPVKDWKPWTATGGEANPNRLKGTTSYVEQDGSILTAATRATFNMVAEIPFDTLTTDSMGFDIQVLYTYTGTAPAPAFQFNDAVSGTEGTPTWTGLTINTHGFKHTRSGATSTTLYADIPLQTYVQPAFLSIGSGLNDLTAGGSYSGSANAKFEVEIDATGTPDTFKWRKNVASYTTGVAITGGAQTLSDEVTVTFAATTGHTLANEWTIYAGSKDTAECWATT